MKSVERQPKKEYDKPEVIETGGLFDKEGVKSAKIEDFIRIHFTDANSHFYLLTDAELGRIFNVSGEFIRQKREVNDFPNHKRHRGLRLVKRFNSLRGGVNSLGGIDNLGNINPKQLSRCRGSQGLGIGEIVEMLKKG